MLNSPLSCRGLKQSRLLGSHPLAGSDMSQAQQDAADDISGIKYLRAAVCQEAVSKGFLQESVYTAYTDVYKKRSRSMGRASEAEKDHIKKSFKKLRLQVERAVAHMRGGDVVVNAVNTHTLQTKFNGCDLTSRRSSTTSPH